MTKPNEGQASIELMVVVGILLTVFIILGYIVYKNYVRTADLKIYIYGTRLANHMADQINAVNAVGNGYSTVFKVPETLYGSRNYTVNFYRGESSLFIEGSSFSTGGDLKFPSPLSTSNIHCLMDQCANKCNSTTEEECVQVNETMRIRAVKHEGGIYLTPEYNVMQPPMGEFIVPFEGGYDPDPERVEEFAKDATDRWNVIYLYHNTVNDTTSLVFSLNLTTGDTARMYFHNIIGDIRDVKTNDALPTPELKLDAYPPAEWKGSGPDDIDGGVITFKGGFHICVEPGEYMPSYNWRILSSDGRRIALDPTEEVCITYP
jgi:hypothetical protein